MVRTRIVTGSALTAAFLLLAWLDSPFAGGPILHVLVGGLFVCALIEFYVLAERQGHQPVKIAAVALLGAWVVLDYALRVPGASSLGAWLHISSATLPGFYAMLGFGLPVALAVLAMVHLFTRNPERSLPDLSVTVLGIVYIWGLGAHVFAIREQGMAYVLMFVAVAKLGDAGAYFVGMRLGRHPLAPRTSPKKTIEGAVGGLVVSVAGALLLAPVLRVGGAVGFWVVFGLIVGAVSQIGDLVESALKRSAGAKDSGGFIPQFGGILDLIDSPLLSAPVAYWLLATI
jgi:phosphatidate cytidylyltransferase